MRAGYHVCKRFQDPLECGPEVGGGASSREHSPLAPPLILVRGTGQGPPLSRGPGAVRPLGPSMFSGDTLLFQAVVYSCNEVSSLSKMYLGQNLRINSHHHFYWWSHFKPSNKF